MRRAGKEEADSSMIAASEREEPLIEFRDGVPALYLISYREKSKIASIDKMNRDPSVLQDLDVPFCFIALITR